MMFESSTRSKVTAATSALLLVFVALGCNSGSSGGGGSSGTRVTSVTPLDDSTSVSGGSLVTARFNKQVAPITGGASFTVACELPCTDPGGVVSVDSTNRVATFTPSTVLDDTTLYTATVTGVESLSSGRAMTNPYVWTFTTGASAVVRPTVTLTEPVTTNPGPTLDVPIDTAISAMFSEAMLESSIDGASFLVTCLAPCVSPAGVVSYDSGSFTADFTPAEDLAVDTTYTVRITTAAVDLTGDALGGNQAAPPAASDYIWSFTTVARPTVTAVAPVDDAASVPVNIMNVSAEFSEAMAPISGPATFTLTCPGPCTNPTGTVALDSTMRIATYTLTPATSLEPLTIYTATITGAQSLATGLAMADPYSWTFKTSAAMDATGPQVMVTEPVTSTPGPTLGVPSNTAVSAVLSEDISPATVDALTFTLTCSGPCVSPLGVVSYSVGSRTAVFTPAAELDSLTTYTATLTTGVEDLAGNALYGNQGAPDAPSDYVWTFTTGAAVAAASVTVFSTNPDDGDLGVCPTAGINATFDVPSGLRMNPLTINSTTFTVTGPAPASMPVLASSVVLDSATGTIATFTPATDLVDGVTYTATIAGGLEGVKDMAIPANGMMSDFTWSFTAGPPAAICVQPVSLKTMEPFGTYGGIAGMTNTGIQSVVNGDIGTDATGTSSITGFHDTMGDIYTETLANIGAVNGVIFTCTNSTTGPTSAGPNAPKCAIASQARLDAQAAYLQLVAIPPGSNPGGNLAGLTLAPGVYTAPAGSFLIEGSDLTLDAQGDANAVFVFQMASTLRVGGPGAAFPQSVILAGGAQAKNVFWQVGSFATINEGGGGTMMGTIIAQSGASFSTVGNTTIVTLNGRAISLNASVTLVDTIINVPAP
jgi:hypothetical protein